MCSLVGLSCLLLGKMPQICTDVWAAACNGHQPGSALHPFWAEDSIHRHRTVAWTQQLRSRNNKKKKKTRNHNAAVVKTRAPLATKLRSAVPSRLNYVVSHTRAHLAKNKTRKKLPWKKRLENTEKSLWRSAKLPVLDVQMHISCV